MDEIAEKANVSKVTIYKYFIDKDTLYLEVGKHIFFHYTGRLNHIILSDDVLIKKLYDYLDVISEFTNSGLLDLGIELTHYNQDVEHEYNIYLQEYRNSMFTLIVKGINDGLFKSGLHKDMIFHYIDMGIVYYQQCSEYRNKMLIDRNFKQQFLLFYISNIFIDSENILSINDEVL